MGDLQMFSLIHMSFKNEKISLNSLNFLLIILDNWKICHHVPT